MAIPRPDNETRRVARLRALAVLDTESEPLFDSLVEAASLAAGAPMAAINLIDAERQWTKASVGMVGARECSRDLAFCAHVLCGPELLEVVDTRLDPRFAHHPEVTVANGVRYYLGVPIVLSDGLCMGALCVLDRRPRPLEDSQRATLRALAAAASHALEQRLVSQDRESLLDRTGRLANVGGWGLDLTRLSPLWTPETCRIHELPASFEPTLEEALRFFPASARRQLEVAMERARSEGIGWDLELPLTTATGRKIWVRIIGGVDFYEDGEPLRLVGAIQDITIRRRVVSALEASERRFRQIFEYSLGLICMHDHEGVMLSVNPAAARSLGYTVGELLGRPLTDLMPPERHAAFRDYLLRIITIGNDSGVLELIAKSGSRRVWQYQNVLDDEADEPYILGHAQDITERFETERTLRIWSQRDALTGCFNRRYLVELTAQEGVQWGCITVDLDHFKQVNDTYGHQRGDEVLIGMARFLERFVRSRDAVVRLGGDEFMLLLRDADAGVTGQVVARIDAERSQAPIAFTLGSATFGPGSSLEQGMAEADHKLYRTRAETRGHDSR